MKDESQIVKVNLHINPHAKNALDRVVADMKMSSRLKKRGGLRVSQQNVIAALCFYMDSVVERRGVAGLEAILAPGFAQLDRPAERDEFDRAGDETNSVGRDSRRLTLRPR